MIKRLTGWTPSNLPVAFVATSVIGAVFSIVFWIVISGLAEPDSTGDSSFPAGDIVPIGLIAVAVAVSVTGIGLAIFGILPTLWLRRFEDHWWTWPIAPIWGGVSAMALVLLLTWSLSRDIAWAAFVCGAFCGLLWRTLAGRVIRSQAEGTSST